MSAHPEEPAPTPDLPAGDPAPRRVDVGPDDVWQPGPSPQPRWAHRSMMAPILMVVVISAGLVYGFIALAGLAWRLLR